MSRVRKSNERKSTMLSTKLKIGSAWLCMAAIPAISGCANDKTYTRARVGFLELHGKDCDRLAWSGTASESSKSETASESSKSETASESSISGTATASSSSVTTTASSKYKQGYAKRKHNTALAPRSTSEPASTRDMPPNLSTTSLIPCPISDFSTCAGHADMPILNRKAMDEVNAGSRSSGQDRRSLFSTSVQRKQEPPHKEYTGSHGLEAS